MDFEKLSDTEFQAVETKQEVKKYNIVDLQNDKKIYLQHVAEYLAKVDAVDALLAEAESLGIVEPEPITKEIQ